MQYLLAFLFAILISAFYYHRSQPALSPRRRLLLGFLRTVMLFILLLILLSPILYFSRTRRQAPKVLMLKDNSASMDLDYNGSSKAKYLSSGFEALADKYSQAGYDVQKHSFANGLEGDKDNSLLVKSLQELSAKEKLSDYAAIVLASDGWLRDEDLGIINRIGVPIHSIADSSRQEIPDLQILSAQANRYAYRNEATVFRVRAKATSFKGSASVKLYLGNSLIGRQSLQMEPDAETSIDFTHRFANIGFFNYRVEIEPLEKEKHLGNNSLPGAIEVLSEKEHILIFSDSPAWDNKFIIDAISTNPRWDVMAYQIKDGRIFRGESPTSVDTSNLPAVIVVINNGRLSLDSQTQALIKGWVNRGSGLFTQGLPILELADILPITRSNIQTPYQGFVNMNSAANAYPMLSELITDAGKLPPLDYYYVNAAEGSEILATLNNPQKSPALVLRQNGQSRALGLSFLNLWRWQLQSADGAYQKLIVNCLTWLSNKALGAYSAIYKSSYLQGEEIRIRLRAEDSIRSSDLDGNPRIVIFDKEGKELEQDFMTRDGEEYSFISELTKAGEYRFEIQETGKKSAGRFVISESLAEARDFDFNLPLLQYLSSESRGRVILDPASFTVVPAQARAYTLRSDFPLYKKWYIIALFILSFCLELFLRRRWGLL